jgi:cytochrome c-type protein NapC
LLLLLLVVAPIAIGAGWIGAQAVIERTSDAEFCTACHSMTPFARTHAEDVHGGGNPSGFVAECVGCHLPHDTPTNYLLAKLYTGLRDLSAQSQMWLHQPDWLGGLAHRADYVYDSGCLNCHAALERVAPGNENAAAAHQAYRSGRVEHCVTCHQHVGHKDLRVAIIDHFDITDAPGVDAGGDLPATRSTTELDTGPGSGSGARPAAPRPDSPTAD